MDAKLDRVPPNSAEAEQCVIGCILWNPKDCLPDVQAEIHGDGLFYDLRHQVILDGMTKMADNLKPIEIFTLAQQLKDDGMLERIGGIVYLSACQDAVPSAANLSHYLDIVRDKATLRKMIRTCTDAVARIYDNEAEAVQLLDVLERDVLAIRPDRQNGADVKTLVQESLGRLQERYDNPYKIFGITTGLEDLDRLVDGVHGGEMVVIAGLPSTGKSALAGGIAFNAALKGFPVGIFTAEMSPLQFVMRGLCSESRVNSKRMNERDIMRLSTPSMRISKSPVFIERASGLTIGQVVAMARRMKQRHGIRIVVVDYIQLLSGVGDNREQAVASISKGLKGMALELDCAVLALSQLNDQGKLRESRAIGQDADTVWKLENDGEWNPQVQPIILTVEKCRDGETGQIKLLFQKTFTRFECVSKVSEEDVPQND